PRQVRHAHRAVLVHRLGQLLGRARDRAPGHLPAGLADVHRLGDDADLGLGAGPDPVAVLPEVRDRLRHPFARRSLRDPSVAALGDPPQRRAARPADPDRRAGPVHPPGPPAPPARPPPRRTPRPPPPPPPRRPALPTP